MYMHKRRQRAHIDNIGTLLVVGSGKGGVGKSTATQTSTIEEESDTVKGDHVKDERED